MKFASIVLLVIMLVTIQISTTVKGSGSPDFSPCMVSGAGPSTMLDGIDWDEWLESIGTKLLDGIDWDEWLDNLFIPKNSTTA